MARAQARQAPKRELEILNAAAETLNSVTDVEVAMERTLALVADLLGLDTGWVWLRAPDSGQFYLAAARNLPPYLREPVRMTGYACWCIESFEDGELSPKNVDIIECSRLRPAVKARQDDSTQDMAYHASLPLGFRNAQFGIMNVTAPGLRQLTREELRLLSTVAYQLGLAVERAHLADESARLALAEERARLAREIHDTLAQDLTAIGLHVEGALTYLEADPAVARERLQRALDTTRESLEEARRSVENLRSLPLEGRPLSEALAALGRTFTSETGIPVHLRTLGQPRTVPPRIEAEVFRIAQEALTNVREHARATEVTLTLHLQQSDTAARLQLVVQDNGRGFNTSAATRADGFGLQGMRERARLLGGQLRASSQPGHGTSISLRVPLPVA